MQERHLSRDYPGHGGASFVVDGKGDTCYVEMSGTHIDRRGELVLVSNLDFAD
jgi:hypothetical protein